MKIKRLFYGLALASIAFAISSFGINAVSDSDIISVKTKPEAIQAKFNPITDASSYKAYIKSSGDYQELDSELIFVKNDYIEVNAVGLTNGTYSLKLVPIINNNEAESSKIELSNISVDKDDRSGYAHHNYSNGIGAYNDDGTLKDNAIKVYVNESNKNTVTATVNGKERTGIAEIIKNAKSSSESLDIRIIGEVGAATWNQIEYDPNGTYRENKDLPISNVVDKNGNRMPAQTLSQEQILEGGHNTLNESYTSKLNGLTNKIKYESEDKGYDSNYNMLDLDGVKNVTVEGIGSDASIFQWGFNWKRSYYIEVKNLTFNDYPEDACSFEGIETTVSKTTTSFDVDDIACGNYWVHNCTFNQGKNYWDVSKEQDKHEGDGATDFKYLRNATISYNHYYQNHKTGLVGGSESNVTANITFHHNWYQENQSRMPYARQANMHMYNNYYDSSTGTTMQIYAGAYAFIESCYFKNDKKTFVLDDKGYNTPAIKSYNNTFDGSKTYDSATRVTDRATHVSNGNIFNQNFDTDSSFFYLNNDGTTKVTRMDDVDTLPTLLPTISGVIFNDTTYTIVQEQAAEDDNYVIYDSLLDVDFRNETISNSAVSKGLYYTYSSGGNDTDNNASVENDRLYIKDTSDSATTNVYYVFENTYNSGIIKYIVEFSAQSSGSWTMLTFDGSTQIGIGTNKNEKRLSYKVGNNDQVVLLNNAIKDNKKNKVILTIDYDNNIANININGTQGIDFSYSSTINKLYFKTATAERSFYVDSISVMKVGTQVSGLDINTGYQMGQYSVQGTNYKAVRIIGKYEYSELFDDINDIDYINIRFDIYDNSSNFFNSITIKITDIYPSLLDSNSNVLAPEKDNVRYFYAVINGITSSYNGYVINGTTIISANNKIIESSVSLTLEV